MSAQITPAPLLHARQGYINPGCSTLSYIFVSCESRFPDFNSRTGAAAASCLCYDSSSVWQPNVYDSAEYSCEQYLKTADPEGYSMLPGTPNPTACLSIGNVASATSTYLDSTLQTPLGGINPTTVACGTWASLTDSCLVATPNYFDYPITDQASCVCYDGTTFDPKRYDGAARSCASFFKTADPETYSAFWEPNSSILTFCESAGDVRAHTGRTTVVAASSTSMTNGPTTSANSPAAMTPSSTAGGSNGADLSKVFAGCRQSGLSADQCLELVWPLEVGCWSSRYPSRDRISVVNPSYWSMGMVTLFGIS